MEPRSLGSVPRRRLLTGGAALVALPRSWQPYAALATGSAVPRAPPPPTLRPQWSCTSLRIATGPAPSRSTTCGRARRGHPLTWPPWSTGRPALGTGRVSAASRTMRPFTWARTVTYSSLVESGAHGRIGSCGSARGSRFVVDEACLVGVCPWGHPVPAAAQGTAGTGLTVHCGALGCGGAPRLSTSARLLAAASRGVSDGSPYRHSIILRMEVWS